MIQNRQRLSPSKLCQQHLCPKDSGEAEKERNLDEEEEEEAEDELKGEMSKEGIV